MRRGGMALVCLALVGTTPAFAQETQEEKVAPEAQAPTAPAPAIAPRSIEEIVVTARKKEESIQDVPISITALDGDFLQEAGVDDFHELAEFAPNVRFTTNACCTTVFIRGFGTPFAAGAFDPTVGLALDELSIAKEIYMSDPLFDIERFEVLRGPQGTLFGKNTTAGLFNITTASPSDEVEGYVLGGIGGLGTHRLEAALGGPIGEYGDWVRFRIAAVDLDGPGDVENTALDVDEPATGQQAGRLKLEISPLESLDVMLIGSLARTESRFFHIQSYDFPDATVDFIRDFDPEFEDDPFNHQNSIDHRDGLERDTVIAQANVRWTPEDFGPIRAPEIVAVLGWTDLDQQMALDVDFSPLDAVAIEKAPNSYLYDQKSIELRGGGTIDAPFGFGELSFLVGGFLYESNLETYSPLRAGQDIEEYLLGPPGFELATGAPPILGSTGFSTLGEVATALGLPPLPSVLAGDGASFFLDQKTTSQAVFGNVAWRFLDQFEISGGGRLSLEKKDARVQNVCFDPGVLCAALMVQEFTRDETRDETDFSPKVTLSWFPLDDLTLFATRAQGFKSGAFNNFSFTADAVEVDSEKAVSWEVGAKGKWLDRSLSYAVTLFQMEVEDLQLQNTLGALVQVRNAGSARTRGVEVDLQWLTPWEPLAIRGSGAFTDGEFEEFPNAPPIAGSSATSQDLAGREMPFVPDWQMNLTPELRFPVPSPISYFEGGLVLIGAVDVLYRSEFYLDSDLDPHTLEEGYVMLNGRVGVATDDGKISLTLSVDNVTDADVLEYQTDSLLYPGGYVAMQEFQRTWGLQAKYAF
jgi:iron complex outermembrane recepter protein